MAFRRRGAWALGKAGPGGGGLRSKKARPEEFTKPVFKCGDNHDGGLEVPAGHAFPAGTPGLGSNRKMLQVGSRAGGRAGLAGWVATAWYWGNRQARGLQSASAAHEGGAGQKREPRVRAVVPAVALLAPAARPYSCNQKCTCLWSPLLHRRHHSARPTHLPALVCPARHDPA